MLQLGLSGGEPLVRGDVEELAAPRPVAGALHDTGDFRRRSHPGTRADKLRDVGLEHIQISIQDSDEESRI